MINEMIDMLFEYIQDPFTIGKVRRVNRYFAWIYRGRKKFENKIKNEGITTYRKIGELCCYAGRANNFRLANYIFFKQHIEMDCCMWDMCSHASYEGHFKLIKRIHSLKNKLPFIANRFMFGGAITGKYFNIFKFVLKESGRDFYIQTKDKTYKELYEYDCEEFIPYFENFIKDW